MDDNETIRQEIIFYISECLDLSIKAADNSDSDISQDAINLNVLYDLLNTLHYLEEKMNTDTDEKINPDENAQ